MTILDDKRRLRNEVLAMRDRLAPEFRARASRAIAARIQALAAYADARVVLLTLPFRSEWDTALVAAHALRSGKRLAVPRIDTAARMLRPLRVRDLVADIERGYRGVPEPRASCEAVALEAIDFVVVPGAAFDEAGRRLGYGGGFFDRLLPHIAAASQRVAGAFDAQIVARVPAASHDVGVPIIVTERRLIDCASARA
jgi:5-formyltetrahydrofolate cyclo-ligase